MLEFTKILSKNLLKNNFHSTNSNENVEFFTENTKCIDFYNHLGQDICFLRIFNTENADFTYYESSHLSILQNLKNQGENLNSSKIYILYLFIGIDIKKEFIDLINTGNEFIGQELYTIYWGAEISFPTSEINQPLKKYNFFNSKNQPSELGNIHKILTQSVEEYFNNTEILPNTMHEIKQEVHKKDPFKKTVDIPIISYFLIIINAIVLGLIYLNGGPRNIETLVNMGALVPKKVFADGEYYRLFTVMFLHGGIGHFASNSLGIYIFGTRLEKYMGHLWFSLLYVVSGLGASVVGLIFIKYIAVGASGAIYGLIGAFLAFSCISRKNIEGFSLYFMVLYCTISVLGSFFMANIANSMHIGGFITGFILGYAFFKIRGNLSDNQV